MMQSWISALPSIPSLTFQNFFAGSIQLPNSKSE